MNWILYQLNTLWRRLFNRRKFVIPIIEQLTQNLPYKDGSIIYNNKWGGFKVRGKWNYLQGITPKGWKFLAPVRNFGVIGYPCIRKAFSPIKVREIKKMLLVYDFDVQLKNGTKYNLAADIWLFDTPTFEWRSVKAEVMVWEDCKIAKPHGKFLGNYSDGMGNYYKLYGGWVDKSKESVPTNGWQIFSFIQKEKRTKGRVNLKSLLQQLPLEYASCNIDRVELGTEVFNSDGVVEIKKFNLFL